MIRRDELMFDSVSASASQRFRSEFLRAAKPMISHAASAKGARIAVSLVKAARANQSVVANRWPSTYAASAQKIHPAAARSTCARELCTKKTGYSAVHNVDAIATFLLATRSAKRNTPRSEKAARTSIAV